MPDRKPDGWCAWHPKHKWQPFAFVAQQNNESAEDMINQAQNQFALFNNIMSEVDYRKFSGEKLEEIWQAAQEYGWVIREVHFND